MNDQTPSSLPPFTIGYRLMLSFVRFLLWLVSDFKAEGVENIPLSGPAVLVSNHLDTMDGAAVFAILPRQVTVFAADKHNRRLSFLGWLLRTFANAIWVARGEVDRKALRAALDAVARGEMLAIAPEGTRSKTGALQKGHDGTAYLVARSGAPIVPVVAWGQEKIWSELAHLRRSRVHLVVGKPFSLPPEAAHARSAELAVYTEQIMRRLASLLPPAYRGVYADKPVAGGSA